mmetsp:Transcript_52442/g.164720  ORF Transcript_52442/g.164720 Transcript_52442/m.164720 type:complete len:415 (+) Transcript_52442:78-1322(+)
MIWLGILLAICAAAIGTTSKQLIAASEHFGKPWLFHLGAGMNILVGPFVDASAYAFAPQVIVAPFACLDVIFNAISAPYMLRWQNEKLTRSHIHGTALVFLGAMCTSIFAQADNIIYNVRELEEQLFWRPTSVLYLTVELGLILTVNLALRKKLLSPAVRGISLGVVAGILMGNIFFMKGVIGIIQTTASTGNYEAWFRPTPYILATCAAGGAIMGHIFMRKGLGEYKGVFMVTIFEGAHISAGCLSGCVVMEEMAGAPGWRYILYWVSVTFIILGMLIINKKSAEAQLSKGQGDVSGHGEPKFHIAQSFVAVPPDEDRHELYTNGEGLGHNAVNSLESMESPIGRTLEEHSFDAVDMVERGGGKKWHSNGPVELAEDTTTPSTRMSSLLNGDRSLTLSGVSNAVDSYDSPLGT